MKKKQLYEAPASSAVEVKAGGVVCASGSGTPALFIIGIEEGDVAGIRDYTFDSGVNW